MGDCLQGHNWRPGSRMVALAHQLWCRDPNFAPEMSCLCFLSSLQPCSPHTQHPQTPNPAKAQLAAVKKTHISSHSNCL